jgi:hypothetical protein
MLILWLSVGFVIVSFLITVIVLVIAGNVLLNELPNPPACLVLVGVRDSKRRLRELLESVGPQHARLVPRQ